MIIGWTGSSLVRRELRCASTLIYSRFRITFGSGDVDKMNQGSKSLYRHFIRELGRLAGNDGGRRANLRRLYRPQLRALLTSDEVDLDQINMKGESVCPFVPPVRASTRLSHSRPNDSYAATITYFGQESLFSLVPLLPSSSTEYE